MDEQLTKESDTSKDLNFEKEWIIDFHSVKYIINLTVNSLMLYVDVEQSDSNDRWTGEFTSQYIEEITHKAGNFKKFNVFVKMLSSSFSKESESVFIDLLTFSDLEALKARKVGNSTSNSSTSSTSMSVNNSNHRSYLKRYLILTYSGEFDRVHYPLPLAYEESPNPEAMRRTITRLRKQVSTHSISDEELGHDKEKEIRVIVAQLRQENTELRHRLRQSESRIKSLTAASTSISHGPTTNNSTVNELTSTNSKLRKHIDSLKKELSESSKSYENLRTTSSKEILNLKKIVNNGQDHLDIYSRNNSDLSNKNNSKINSSVESSYRKKISDLERELAASHKRYQQDIGSTTRGVNTNVQNRNSPYRSSMGSKKSDTYLRSTSPSTTSKNQRSISPSPSYLQSIHSNTRSRSVSPSSGYHSGSSLGGRFDPTAYSRERAEKVAASKAKSAWGVSSNRYQESGYSSANSQSSYGSHTSRGSRKSQQQDNSNTRGRNDNKKDSNLPHYMSDSSINSKRGNDSGIDSQTSSIKRKNVSRKSHTRGKPNNSDTEDDEGLTAYKSKKNYNKDSTNKDKSKNKSNNNQNDEKKIKKTKKNISTTSSILNSENDENNNYIGIADTNHRSSKKSPSSNKDKININNKNNEIKSDNVGNNLRASIEKINVVVNAAKAVSTSSEFFKKNDKDSQDNNNNITITKKKNDLSSNYSTPGSAEKDISEIDKRIIALQSYLDKARMGMLADENNTP